MDAHLIQVLKVIAFSSILFVWVIRYQNIVEEFKFFGYPAWLRDFVGIMKISFAILILSTETTSLRIGSAGIVVLMLGALVTHLKVRNPFHKMIPSFLLLCLSVVFFFF